MSSARFLNLTFSSLWDRFSAFLRQSDFPAAPDDRKKPAALLFDVDETPPLLVQFGVSLQHVFLMFVSCLYVLVIVNSIGGAEIQAENLIRISMIASGIATILQARRGVVGSGYFCPLSSSLTFLPPSILAVQAGGFPLLFGMVAFAGAFTTLFSRLARYMRVLFPPEVTGLMVAMTGLQLVAIGCPRFVGYTGPGTPAHPKALLIGFITLVTMVFATVWNKKKLHMLPLLIGLILGYSLSLALGVLPWSRFLLEVEEPWVSLPHRAAAGLAFRLSLLAPFIIACLTANLKTVGDLTLCQKINDAEWKRTDMRSISGGIFANGIGTFLSGLAGGVAQNTVSSTVGLSLATGTTSRALALPTGLIVIAFAFFPKLAAVLAVMPAPVVGAMLVYSACFIVIGGFQLLTSRMLDARRIFAVGIAFIFGLSAEISPDLYRNVPDFLAPVVHSSVAFATVLVISLSLIFRIGIARRIRFRLSPDSKGFDAIQQVIEQQGAAWGMRPEVAVRAQEAVHEVVSSALALNPALKDVDVSLAFDELKLEAEVSYEGLPLEIPDSAPSFEALQTEQGIMELSTFLIRQHADQVKVKSRKGLTTILIHLDH